MGVITQEIFYTLRAYGIWFDKVDHVIREDDGRMTVCLSNADVTAWESFPGSKFRTLSERHAVLASGNGLYAVQMLRGLFRTWLGRLAYTLREVYVQPRDQNLVVFLPSHRRAKIPAIPATHWLFCFTLPDGSDYAVDFANAQFAHVPTRMHFYGIMPWSDYMSHLQLSGAETEFHQVLDENFIPQTGPYGLPQIKKDLFNHLRRKTFWPKHRDQFTHMLTWFSMILSLENCLYQRFHKEKNDPTVWLTGVLASPAADFILYRRRIMEDLRLFILAWRIVLKCGETCMDAPESPAGFLKKMWGLMSEALRETHGMALQRMRLSDQAELTDTPQQSV
jgi:hypothetical protein